ncbi:MAG TPA: DUF1646 family protein [Terriglobales bacterium]|nr:DUF1646 family protein [Terriglobales bacterium]
MENTSLAVGLSLIFLVVLLGPFFNGKVERNLEGFLFVMGVLSATLSRAWTEELVVEGLVAPIKITLAVLGAGILFHYLRSTIDAGMKKLLEKIPLPVVVSTAVVVLGLLSSVISAIIAALVLVEFITVLRLHRRSEISLTIIACFAIGLGAALTPLGEPLSTIVVSKLSGPPYEATFFFLTKLLGFFVIPAVALLSALAAYFVRDITDDSDATLSIEAHEEKLSEVLMRAVKVYVFVMALIFLGAGFKPMIDTYLSKIPSQGLFWVNMVSAVLDNATLAAAEIGPALRETQIKSALLGLLISGGMLIPGNIPNIIAAHSLRIRSTEWARLGVSLGLIVMAVTAALIAIGIV